MTVARHDNYVVDLLDRLLDVGVVIRGTIIISVADIELLFLDANILLSSVERALSSERRDGTPARMSLH